MSTHPPTPPAVPPSSVPSASAPLPPPGDYYLEMEQRRNLKDYIHILLRRKWWFLGAFLAVFLSAGLHTFLRTPIYRPLATLQITQDNPGSHVSADDKLSLFTGGDSLEKFQQTQYKILQSRSLAARVIHDLNLKEHPDFKPIAEGKAGKTQAEIEDAMVELFLKKLEITPVRNSYLVEVSFESPDKAMAQQVINTIADAYMQLSIDRRNESFMLVRNWLNKQLQNMAAKVQEAQKKLYKFGQETDIYTLEDKDNVIVQKFIDLSALLTKAQAEKMAKEAQFKQIKEKGPNAPLIVNHPLVAQLRQQLVVQQARVSALQKVFRGGHPELQAEQANLGELQGRLQAEVHRLQESVKADYEAAQRTEKLLEETFIGQKEQMVKLQANLTDYQILKRDAQTNEQLYQALLARVKEANIAGTMVPANVAVIDPAPLPSKPYKPKKFRNLALAAFLGLILGLVLALLRENLDDSVKSAEDLEGCNLPFLGVLPLLDRNGPPALGRSDSRPTAVGRYLPRRSGSRQGIISSEDADLMVSKYPETPFTEALRQTQTSIMLSVSGRPPTALMITSPHPEEGKTTVAVNLAQSFALHERPTVIIDGDLRKPRIHKTFQLDPQPGLTNYITGHADLHDILRPTSVPNLVVITAGPRSPSPGNLLNSEIFHELLALLRQQFRQLVIDTPPILGFSDARQISSLVDGVILVTKHQHTQKTALKLAHQLLSQIHAPVMGAILNGVDITSRGYGGYHFHYHYYAKYYGEQRAG
ncbi:MAG: polysaccharide biosynthesis tyrosine autokinase [Deltaproteobacteria bacterium]|nr:polysaccharide biosynthesis tyrosine autokinase [Deltaproteobacteria bacterium]